MLPRPPRMPRPLLPILLAALAALGASGPAAAQGAISGTVVDPATEFPVIGASVLVIGTTRGAATDEAIVHSAYARSVRAAAGFDTSDRNVAAAPSIGARVNASGGAENIAADAKASQASDWATTANEHTASRATMIAA